MGRDDQRLPSKGVEEAVERLLAFNEQYRAQVESNAKRLLALAQATAKSTADHGAVVEQSSLLAKVAQDVEIAFTRLETETQQLTAMTEECRDVIRSTFGVLPNLDKRLVSLIGTMARAVADHQRQVATTLIDNAVTLRASLDGITQKLAIIADAANGQVAILDDALNVGTDRNLAVAGRRLNGLSEVLASRAVG